MNSIKHTPVFVLAVSVLCMFIVAGQSPSRRHAPANLRSTVSSALGIKVPMQATSYRGKNYYTFLVQKDSVHEGDYKCSNIIPFLDTLQFASLPPSVIAHIAADPTVMQCLTQQYVFQNLNRICPSNSIESFGHTVYTRTWGLKSHWEVDTICLTKAAIQDSGLPESISSNFGGRQSYLTFQRLGLEKMKDHIRQYVTNPSLYKMSSITLPIPAAGNV